MVLEEDCPLDAELHIYGDSELLLVEDSGGSRGFYKRNPFALDIVIGAVSALQLESFPTELVSVVLTEVLVAQYYISAVAVGEGAHNGTSSTVVEEGLGPLGELLCSVGPSCAPDELSDTVAEVDAEGVIRGPVQLAEAGGIEAVTLVALNGESEGLEVPSEEFYIEVVGDSDDAVIAFDYNCFRIRSLMTQSRLNA